MHWKSKLILKDNWEGVGLLSVCLRLCVCVHPVAVLRQVFGLSVCGGTIPVQIANGLEYFAQCYKKHLTVVRAEYIHSYQFSQIYRASSDYFKLTNTTPAP